MFGGYHVVKLLRRVILRCPRLPRVGRDCAAAIVAIYQMRSVIRIDPEIMMIAVRAAELRGGLAAVRGTEERSVLHIYHVGIPGIGADVRVVKGTLPNSA